MTAMSSCLIGTSSIGILPIQLISSELCDPKAIYRENTKKLCPLLPPIPCQNQNFVTSVIVTASDNMLKYIIFQTANMMF